MQANYGCGDIEEKYDDYTKTYHPGTTGVSCSLLRSLELKHTDRRIDAPRSSATPRRTKGRQNKALIKKQRI